MKNARVLILDDEIDIVDELRFCLESNGIRCICHTDPMEAKRHLTKNTEICVLISDVRMPGVDGTDLAREISQSRPPDKALEVILVTGWAGDQKIIDVAQKSGFVLLPKPTRCSQIAKVAEQALARAVAKREAIDSPH